MDTVLDKLELAAVVYKAAQFSSESITIADFTAHDLPLIFTNAGFTLMSGYNSKDVIGKNCRFMQGNQDNSDALNTMHTAFKNQDDCTVILKNERKSGEVFYNELHLSPLFSKDGSLTHYVGIQHDISERIISQEVVKSMTLDLQNVADKSAKQYNQLLRINSMIANDLRNPLSAIITTLSMTKKMLLTENISNSNLNKMIDRALDNSQDILEVFTNFIDNRKVDFENKPLSNETYSIVQNLKKLVNRYTDKISGNNLQLNIEIDDNLPLIYTDRYVLNSVFDNLISNSINYTLAGKAISVKAYMHDGNILVEFEDNGIGLSDDLKGNLYKEFYKDNSISEKMVSSLGLYIAKQNLEMLGVKFEFKSVQGNGTIFIIQFNSKHFVN